MWLLEVLFRRLDGMFKVKVQFGSQGYVDGISNWKVSPDTNELFGGRRFLETTISKVFY